jgi:hypothetical protein
VVILGLDRIFQNLGRRLRRFPVKIFCWQSEPLGSSPSAELSRLLSNLGSDDGAPAIFDTYKSLALNQIMSSNHLILLMRIED